jgi:uncharacterized repeat protein (TIGR01451 family)
MRIANFLFTTTLLALLGSLSSAALAAEKGAVKLTNIAQTEVEVTNDKGEKTFKRTLVEKAVPGTEVIYTTTFENIVKQPVGNIVINNPVPKNTEYKAGSAFGKDCDIQFSADDGKTYGHAEDLKIKGADGKERSALPTEYTHIRWNYKSTLAAGKTGEVGFRVVVK